MGRSNAQVAHLWAHQTKPKATGSSMFFEGPCIYSYGYHFMIARIAEHKGKKVYLFTTDDYSVSTAKHKNHVSAAIPAYETRFNVPCVGEPLRHDKNIEYFVDQIQTFRKKSLRARTHGMYYRNQVLNFGEAFHKYICFFGLAVNGEAEEILNLFESGKLFTKTETAKIREKMKAAQAADREATKRRREIEAREEAERRDKIYAWAKHNGPRIYGVIDGYHLIRITGDIVETSGGAEVPLDVARQAYRAIKAKKDIKRVGDFPVSEIADDYVVIGCHRFTIAHLDEVLGAEGKG